MLSKVGRVGPGGRCSGWESVREVIGCARAEMLWFPQDTPLHLPSLQDAAAPCLLSIRFTGPRVLLSLYLMHCASLCDLLLAWRLWSTIRHVPAAVASSDTVFLRGGSAWDLRLPHSRRATCCSCLISRCQKMSLTTLEALWQLVVGADLIERASLFASQPAISKFLQNLWV